eukprot:SAG11_NODE_5014_length_1691_cov_1.136935_1_plen_205_part_10
MKNVNAAPAGLPVLRSAPESQDEVAHTTALAAQGVRHDEEVARLHVELEAKVAKRDKESEMALAEVVEEHERLLAHQKTAHDEMLHAHVASEREHKERANVAEASIKLHVAELSETHDAALAQHEKLVAILRAEKETAIVEQKRLGSQVGELYMFKETSAELHQKLVLKDEETEVALAEAIKGHERLLAEQKAAHEEMLHAEAEV